VLGRTLDVDSDDVAFQDVSKHPEAETFPGLLIVRFDADLFFANANVFADHVREAIDAADPRPSVVLIDAESINDVDTTALSIVRDFRDEMAAEGIEIWVARMKSHVHEQATRINGVAPENVYRTVRAAVAAFEARQASSEAADVTDHVAAEDGDEDATD
jgi:MFS superfamily sulfate permease-like transporter